ncbi:MAG: hypothetical protein ACU0DI_06695 [Paracoccaceae bacterium]
MTFRNLIYNFPPHRTAWAAAGNGVLFYDPDNTGAITEKRQYVFTEWEVGIQQ